MHRCLRIVALAGLIGTLVGCRESTELRKFESVGGRFSAMMPGRPKETMQTSPSPVGPIYVTLFASDLPEKRALVVSVTEFPAGRNMDHEVALKGAAANVRGTIESQKGVTVDGRNGLEGLIKISDDIFVRTRIFTLDNRLYQLEALGPEAFVKSETATKFYDSFKAK
jgi:hypothetical protein